MSTAPIQDWQSIAAREQQRVLDSIPTQWRIANNAKEQYDGQAIKFIEKCGVLTSKQLEITRLNATQLLDQICKRQLSAEETCEAFCARAAVAHQLLNCLTDFFPEEAIAYARRLDDEFARTGEPIGRLHGLPMAVKDMWVERHCSDMPFANRWLSLQV